MLHKWEKTYLPEVKTTCSFTSLFLHRLLSFFFFLVFFFFFYFFFLFFIIFLFFVVVVDVGCYNTAWNISGEMLKQCWKPPAISLSLSLSPTIYTVYNLLDEWWIYQVRLSIQSFPSVELIEEMKHGRHHFNLWNKQQIIGVHCLFEPCN